MDNMINIFDMLNQDAEFARQVDVVHRCTAALQKAVNETSKTTEEQKAVSDQLNARAEEVQNLIDRAEDLLLQLREERANLQSDIERHETVLAEMQRLEESFDGAQKAYGNLSAVL